MIRDLANNIKLLLLQAVTLASSTVAYSEAVDTADFELGICFGIFTSNYVGGSAGVFVEQSDDGLGNWAAVPEEKYTTGYQETLNVLESGEPLKVGVFATKRYLRLGFSGGLGAEFDAQIMAIQGAEQMPVVAAE